MNFRKIARKLWNSGTFTQWLNFLISPLRLFLLIPLVLTRWDETELTAFYLLASVIGFTTVITDFVPRILNPVLVFFFAGVEDLDKVGEKLEHGKKPNWKGFANCYATLRSVQRRIGFVLVTIVAFVTVYALVRQFGWEQFKERYLWLPLIVSIQAVFQIIVAGIGGCIRSVGKIALVNRVAVLFLFLQVIGAALMVWYGGQLMAVLLVQFGIGFAHRATLRSLLFKYVPEHRGGTFDREIIKKIKTPSRRGLIGTLSSVGLQRLSPLLMAGTLSNENLVIFSFCLNLFSSLSRAGNGFIASQIPKMGKLYAQGNKALVQKLANERIILSVGFFIVIGPVAIVALSFVMSRPDSSVAPPPVLYGFCFWVFFTARLLVNNFCRVYNITNEMPFYARNLYAAVTTLVLLFLFGFYKVDSIWAPLFAISAPHLIFMGFFPARKFANLVDRSLKQMFLELFRNGWHLANSIPVRVRKFL